MASNWQSEKSKEEGEARRARFLSLVRGENGVPLSIRAACDELGVTRTTVRSWREKDPAFDAAYHDSFDDGTDTLEDAAVSRAVRGVTQDVYHAGEVVGEKTVYSDDLLKFMLAGRRPERFRSGDVSVAVTNTLTSIDDAQVARALSLILAEAKQKQIA